MSCLPNCLICSDGVDCDDCPDCNISLGMALDSI